MDSRNEIKQHLPEEPRYLTFREVPYGTELNGKPVLNRYSSALTNGHDFPGAQVMPPVRLTNRTLTRNVY